MTQRKKPNYFVIGCGSVIALIVILFFVVLSIGRGVQQREARQPTASSSTLDSGTLIVACEKAVRAKLNYPDEAKFVSAFQVGSDSQIERQGGSMIWRSTVRGKNAFGVQSQIPFACSLTRGSQDVVVTMQE